MIVRLNAGPGLREIAPTFGPLVKAWRATAAGYSDDELRLLLDFQRRLEDIVRGQLARLRGEAAGHTAGKLPGHTPAKPARHTPGKPARHTPGKPARHTEGRQRE